MSVEKYCKRAGGPTYYSFVFRVGGVVVSVEDIEAKNQAEAKETAKACLKKALEA